MTATAQITAVEHVIRIIRGGVKPPRVGTAAANMLADHLAAAVETLRGVNEEQAKKQRGPIR